MGEERARAGWLVVEAGTRKQWLAGALGNDHCADCTGRGCFGRERTTRGLAATHRAQMQACEMCRHVKPRQQRQLAHSFLDRAAMQPAIADGVSSDRAVAVRLMLTQRT